MSRQFLELWSERITEKETLVVRKELVNIFTNILDKTPLLDYYWHDNLLLPNPILEKEDNWDIDIFLYYNKSFRDKDEILELLNIDEVLKINRNDIIYSLLFYSHAIDKKIQIDLHIVPISPMTINNYFNYYRIPYFYFILWIILNKINIKLWINGVKLLFINKQGSWEYLVIDKNINTFLYNLFNLDIEASYAINSYDGIVDFLLDNDYIIEYDFFNKDELRWDYLKKYNNNEKLAYIINRIEKDNYEYSDIEDYKNVIYKKLNEKYSFLEMKIEQQITKAKYIKHKNQEQRLLLKNLFWESLEDLDIEMRKLIWLFKLNIDELLLLKEMNTILNNHYWDWRNIYLVWWAVRDILLWLNNKDWDICWAYSPEEFQAIFWWSITEKYWTIFTSYNDLEIEYTPFRVEWNYDWCFPSDISFSSSIEDDSLRRDFTINSIYLDLWNMKLIDFYDWYNDIKNKIIKTVWNPYDRFSEDYLRILRWIRVAAKIDSNIDTNTYEAMIELSNNLNNLSKKRIIEEIFKWFSLWWEKQKRYLYLLDDFWNKSNYIFNMLEDYNNIYPKEIYTLLYFLFDKDINIIKILPRKYSWKTYKAFIEAINVIHKYGNILENIDSIEDLLYVLFFYIRPEKYNDNNFIKKILISIWNYMILEGKLNKEDLIDLLNMKKFIDKNIIYNINLLDIDKKQIIDNNNLSWEDIKKYFFDNYILSQL